MCPWNENVYADLYVSGLSHDLSRRFNWNESAVLHKLRQLRAGKEDQVAHDDIYLCSVTQDLLLCPTIMFPSLSSLATSQGTIIPRQSWKHGSGGYPSKRYLKWDYACFAGVFDGACSVGPVSRVFVGLTGCAEPGSCELGKVANNLSFKPHWRRYENILDYQSIFNPFF